MVIGSSLTPHAALLVHPSGTIHPIVNYIMNLQGQINAACESRLSPVTGLARVWLSC